MVTAVGVGVDVRVRGEALGRCWSPGPRTAVMILGWPLLALVSWMGLLAVVTCTGGISILLVRHDEPCGSEAHGPRP